MMGITLDTEVKPGNRKRRPNYPIEFKRQLAAMACEAGVSVSKLAMDNEVNVNMLFKWRREFRAGLFDQRSQTTTKWLRVEVSAARAISTGAVAAVDMAAPVVPAMIEIVIADAVVRVHGAVDVALLMSIVQGMRT